jgi:hypothetical protein
MRGRAVARATSVVVGLGVIAAFVSEAGGSDALDGTEDPNRQMGADHLAEVRLEDSPGRLEFSVAQEGKRFLFAMPPSEDPDPSPSETTDPRRRPDGAKARHGSRAQPAEMYITALLALQS